MDAQQVQVGTARLHIGLGPAGELTIDGRPLPYKLNRDGSHIYELMLEGRTHHILLLGVDDTGLTLRLQVNGKTVAVTLPDPAARYKSLIGLDKASARTAADLKAPMPGLVRGIRVQPGDQVKKGDPLVVLEAMKMENVLKAAADATVKDIAVQEGAAVEKGALLVRFA